MLFAFLVTSFCTRSPCVVCDFMSFSVAHGIHCALCPYAVVNVPCVSSQRVGYGLIMHLAIEGLLFEYVLYRFGLEREVPL
jgi:hypothetical protein